VFNIDASDPDGDAIVISMRSSGGLDGSEYFFIVPDGRVILQKPLLGTAGNVYMFNVTVSFIFKKGCFLSFYLICINYILR